MLKTYAEGTEFRSVDSASDLMLVIDEGVSKAWATVAIAAEQRGSLIN